MQKHLRNQGLLLFLCQKSMFTVYDTLFMTNRTRTYDIDIVENYFNFIYNIRGVLCKEVNCLW